MCAVLCIQKGFRHGKDSLKKKTPSEQANFFLCDTNRKSKLILIFLALYIADGMSLFMTSFLLLLLLSHEFQQINYVQNGYC